MCFGSQYKDNFKNKWRGRGSDGRGGVENLNLWRGFTRKNRERSVGGGGGGGGGGGDWAGAGGMNPVAASMGEGSDC